MHCIIEKVKEYLEQISKIKHTHGLKTFCQTVENALHRLVTEKPTDSYLAKEIERIKKILLENIDNLHTNQDIQKFIYKTINTSSTFPELQSTTSQTTFSKTLEQNIYKDLGQIINDPNQDVQKFVYETTNTSSLTFPKVQTTSSQTTSPETLEQNIYRDLRQIGKKASQGVYKNSDLQLLLKINNECLENLCPNDVRQKALEYIGARWELVSGSLFSIGLKTIQLASEAKNFEHTFCQYAIEECIEEIKGILVRTHQGIKAYIPLFGKEEFVFYFHFLENSLFSSKTLSLLIDIAFIVTLGMQKKILHIAKYKNIKILDNVPSSQRKIEETPKLQKIREKKEKLQKRIYKCEQRFTKKLQEANELLAKKQKNPKADLEVFHRVCQRIKKEEYPKNIALELVCALFSELNCDRVKIFFKDPTTGDFASVAFKEKKEFSPTPEMEKTAQELIDKVIQSKKGKLIGQEIATGKEKKLALKNAYFSVAGKEKGENFACIPAVGKHDVLGLIYISSLQEIDDDVLKLLTAIAFQMALAVENALLVQQLGTQQRMEQELSTASNIQMSLLPSLVEVPHIAKFYPQDMELTTPKVTLPKITLPKKSKEKLSRQIKIKVKKAVKRKMQLFEKLLGEDAGRPGVLEYFIAKSNQVMKSFQIFIGLKIIPVIHAFDVFIDFIASYIQNLFRIWKISKSVRNKRKRSNEELAKEIKQEVNQIRIQLTHLFCFSNSLTEYMVLHKHNCISDVPLVLEIRQQLDEMKQGLNFLTKKQTTETIKKSIWNFFIGIIPNPFTVIAAWKDLFLITFFMKYSRKEIKEMYIDMVLDYQKIIALLQKNMDLPLKKYEKQICKHIEIGEKNNHLEENINNARFDIQRLIQVLCNPYVFVMPHKWFYRDLILEVKHGANPLFILELERRLTKDVAKALKKKGKKYSDKERLFQLAEALDFKYRYKLQKQLHKHFFIAAND